MATSGSGQTPLVNITQKFSEAFHKFQDRVRERAYHLSLQRDPDDENSLGDWLAAQWELSTPLDLKTIEQKKNLVVEGDLKGFTADEIEVEIVGSCLQVFGSHVETRESTKGEGSGSGSHTVTVFQAVRLPVDVDADNAHAKLFKNGKLKVTLPKKMD